MGQRQEPLDQQELAGRTRIFLQEGASSHLSWMGCKQDVCSLEHKSKDRHSITCAGPHVSPGRSRLSSYLTNEETEAPRGQVICPGPPVGGDRARTRVQMSCPT